MLLDEVTIDLSAAAETGLLYDMRLPSDGGRKFTVELIQSRAVIEEVLGEGAVIGVQGGGTRQESVLRGLAGLPEAAEQVLIHDGARCLAEPALFDRCAMALASGQALIAATPVTDTIKRVDAAGVITNTPDRSELWAAQTPQGFQVDQLRQGHAEAEAKGWTVTDDASLYERLGWPVQVLDAGPSNIKVTTPFDLTVAEAVLALRQQD